MISYDRYQAILNQSDAAVRQAADGAFRRVLDLIRQGRPPRDAIGQALREFNADAVAGLREALSAVLESSLGPQQMRNWPVGGVKLSDRLYQNALQVSALARKVIADHMTGPHRARELAKALYEGYDFKQDPLDIVKPLPKYLQVEFDRFKAAALKTPALRAAYLEAIRKAEAGAGMAELEKALKIAFYERNRYFANRIARTELHRAYTDQQAREWMKQDRIQYLQIRLSSKHPKTDICDLHARLDAYGLGPGVYPKADAPKPPFHPHCRCLTAPMIALDHPNPRFDSHAERRFLAGLPAKEAARVAGSFEKRRRVLEGGESLEGIYNEGKDELYRWKRVGDILAQGTATETGSAVSNAYEAAKKTNGKYHGWLKLQRNLPVHLLEKAIRSFDELIADHESWLQDPTRKNPGFYQLPVGQQKHLLEKHWPDDIQRHRDSIEILRGVIQEKINGHQ